MDFIDFGIKSRKTCKIDQNSIVLSPMLISMMLSLTLVQSSFSKPMRGDEVSLVTEPSATCRILERDDLNRLRYLCSGVLTSPTTVHTAEHCVEEVKAENLTLTIQCGEESFDSSKSSFELTKRGGKVMTGGIDFKETRVAEKIEIDPRYQNFSQSDLARLSFSRPILTIDPVPVATSSEFDQFLEPNGALPEGECWAEGFGVNDFGFAGILLKIFTSRLSYTEGFIYSFWKLPEDQLSVVDRAWLKADLVLGFDGVQEDLQLYRTLRDLKLLRKSFSFGDSGGGLFCSIGPGKAPRLVGIASHMRIWAEQFKLSNEWSLPSEAHFVPLSY